MLILQELLHGSIITSEEVVARHLPQKDGLKDTVAIITGSSAGVGEECARVLMQSGCHVIFAVRSVAKGEKSLARAKALTGGDGQVLRLDTSDMDSVQAFAKEFLANKLPLHYLVLNAGITPGEEKELSAQGFEQTFATNHLGHFLLSRLLEGVMETTGTEADPARVIHVTSAAHKLWKNVGPGATAVENVKHKVPPSDYLPLQLYADTKGLNVLTALEQQRRLGAKSKVIATSVHPGIVSTEMAFGICAGAWRGR